MRRTRKLLSIGHSYVVALNRRLAHEMARVGAEAWEVTAAAPSYYHGDMRPVALEPADPEPCRLVPVPTYLSRRAHVFFYGRRLRSLLRESWDLIHCWEEPFVVAGRQVAEWAVRRTPLVFTTYQNLAKRYPPPFNWLERGSMARAAGWIAGGRTIVAALGSRPGYRERPVRIIPMGVDVEHFQPDPALGATVRHSLGWRTEGPPVVGYLGRFVPEKGVGLLARVLDGLREPWRALFVGFGPLEEALRSWAARHGDRVRVCTEIEHAAVPHYLNAMDVLCAPSQTTRSWREQFGRMLVEAFACGVPVVGSDSGEIPYVLGDAGRVAGEDDEEAWRKALAELLDDPGRRRELGACGMERAHARFAWPVVARQCLDFFEELLAGGTRRASAPLQGCG